MRAWRDYDPSWLVDLAREQQSTEHWLHAALARCTRALGYIPYIYFVDAERANAPDAAWQFERNVTLTHVEHGELVLDVLLGNRIGGVEFLGELLKPR
jgi:hypothetical protein